jgi:hypothetical protein
LVERASGLKRSSIDAVDIGCIIDALNECDSLTGG